MDPRALALVLGAALLHAGWNLRLHRTGDQSAAIAISTFTGGLILAPALVVSGVPSRVLPLVAISVVAEFSYASTLAAAYSRGSLSVAYPIGRGLAPLIVTVAGFAFLGQQPTVLAAAGALLLLLGLVAVATGRAKGDGKTVIFACLSGMAVATYSTVDAKAVSDANPAAYLSLVLLIAGLALLARTRFDLPRLRRAAGQGARIGVGSVTAYLLVLLAFQLAPAGRVATLREVSVLAGVLAAGERPRRRVIGGAVLVVAGAMCAGA